MGQEIRQGSPSSVPWTNSPQVPGNATRTALCAGGFGGAIPLVCRCMSRVHLIVLPSREMGQGARRAKAVFLDSVRQILRAMPWGVNANQGAVRVRREQWFALPVSSSIIAENP